MEINEAEIIKSYQAGNPQDFGLLYDAYVRQIYDFFYFRTFHKPTAEDLTSLTFFKALEKIPSFNSSRGAFRSWLYQIAKHTLIDYFRKNKPALDLDLVENVAGKHNVENEVAARLELAKVVELLKQLSLQQREIVTLRLWDDLSFKEIAEITQKSEAACKMTFGRAIQDWREILALLIIFSLLK